MPRSSLPWGLRRRWPEMSGLVIDLETKRSFGEVGGRGRSDRLGVSLVGSYHYSDDRYACYREEQLSQLIPILRAADPVIGFNLLGFDYPVLAGEVGNWVYRLPTVDLMLEVKRTLGRRVSLNALARATLGACKSGDGLDALRYYREGDWQALERYCLDDVRITKELYDFALEHHCLFIDKAGRKTPVPLRFASSELGKLFLDASRTKGSILMNYGGKERLVDIYSFDGTLIRGYCHLRRARLTFRLDRVESATAS